MFPRAKNVSFFLLVVRISEKTNHFNRQIEIEYLFALIIKGKCAQYQEGFFSRKAFLPWEILLIKKLDFETTKPT